MTQILSYLFTLFLFGLETTTNFGGISQQSVNMSADDIITQQTGPNQVIHARQDSTQELDNLFAASLRDTDGSGRQQSSWHNRKMPDSFYKPTARSHSRENSIDGSIQGDQPQQAGPPGFHSRQASCPASLGGGIKRVTPIHLRTGSLETILDERGNLDHMPLPAGWEASFTADGKRYFIE